MSLTSLLLLIAAQTIWASSYVAMKLGLQGLTPPMVVFLRYFIVVICFIPYWLITGFPKIDRKILMASLVVGAANFYGSPILQVNALQYTQATDVSFLILIEPMLTMLMAFFILKEKISPNLWKVLGLSMLGFFLISDIRFVEDPEPLTKLRFFGNMLFFGSIFFEALCSVTGKYFTKKNKPWNAMGLLMTAGLLCCFSVHSHEIISYDYAAITNQTWAAILFLSLGCSIFAYCTWYIVIAKVPVQYVALSLFLQPVIGSILGFLFFKEIITLTTLLGGGIIVGSLVWWQRLERSTSSKLNKKLETAQLR
jgi:drug/metabolite transporter (DMT)-like permease